jgi:hypothetical protein
MSENNPCEDLGGPAPPPPVCPNGQVLEDGVCVDLAEPLGRTPAPPAPPPVEIEPFPEQHQSYEFRGEEAGDEADPQQENRPLFSSSTRDYITVFNGSFASATAISEELHAVNRRFSYPNHPAHWMRHQPIMIKPSADKFRMAIANMWHRLPDDPLEPSLMLHAVGNPRTGLDIFSPGGITPETLWGEPYKRIINIDSRLQERLYSVSPIANSSQLRETIRFIFPQELISFNATHAAPANLRFAPAATGIVEREFIDVYMLGKDSDHYNSFKTNINNTQAARFYSSGSINFDVEHLDYTYNAPAAFFEKEMDKVLVAPSHSANIEVKIQNVEPTGNLNSELEIPSAYEFYQSVITKKRLDRPDHGIQASAPALVNLGQGLQALLEEYKNVLDLNLENDDFGFVSSKYHKFPSDRVERLEEINKDIRKLAQNFVEIKIKSRQSGHLNSILQSTKMDIMALEFIGQDAPQNPDPAAPYGPDVNQRITRVLDDEFIGTGGNPTLSMTVNDKVRSNIPAVIYKNFDKLIKSLIENPDMAPQNRNLEDYPLYYTGWDNKEILRIEEAIGSQIFLTQLNLACREHELQRSYADILYGRKAYAETIGYKIEKYKLVQDGQQEELIQTFLLMDNNSIDRINFIDSQILSNQEYVYKIFTINLVIGNKYKYDRQETDLKYQNINRWQGRSEMVRDGLSHCFDLSITSDRMILLNCAPFFEKRISTKDRPPITPQVNFLPFNGIDDRYNIMMATNYGESLEKPVMIKKEDRETINRMREAEFYFHGKKVLFKSDSLPRKFEIFRIDCEPKSYRDFAAGLNYTVEATGKIGLFKLDVEPNKYYYYTFRAHDAGGISNPTEVYRVRMVSYQNGIFMEMETFEMNRKPKDFSMKFQRFVHIKPNFMQSTVNFSQVLDAMEPDGFVNEVREAVGIRADRTNTIEFQHSAPPIEDISLGNIQNIEDRVWGKKFKIRVKSKASGKTIDFNISFNSKKRPSNDSV